MNETALKERIKVVAKDKRIQFNEAWKQLLLERFLARLSRSKHQEKFIFKGGLLLAQYLTIGRETTDADFLMRKLQAEASVIENAMRDVSGIEISDGFAFSVAGAIELDQPHMEYPGFRVSIEAKFGKMKDKIQVDVGVGDLVEELQENFQPFQYRGKPIFKGEISLLVYPVETIFAEKLETIISKGSRNSRMKDYHDVVLMSREPNLIDVQKLKPSIESTFSNRKTDLSLPIHFSEDGLASLQGIWTHHLMSLGEFKEKLNLPEQMTEVLKEINQWLKSNGIH